MWKKQKKKAMVATWSDIYTFDSDDDEVATYVSWLSMSLKYLLILVYIPSMNYKMPLMI